MAIRARLAAPPALPPSDWPYHEAKIGTVSSHLFWRGDRRMEAENYLSSGYGLRLAIEERAVGWKRLGQLANVWQPSRLKGIQLSAEHGTPFFAATQVFDVRPVPRKWLSLDRTDEVSQRFISNGTIVVTCSGNVGRSTLVHGPHAGVLISHDLLRLDVVEHSWRGWLYAYLQSPQARAMMTGAQYGHIIKHLEISHLSALPVPVVTDELASKFQVQIETILSLRNRAYQLTLDAEQRFENALGPIKIKDWGETGFTMKASSLFSGRRRLEAIPHNPGIAGVWKHLFKAQRQNASLESLGVKIWLPGRFKRIPAEDGIELVESSDVFETNPDYNKRIADGDFGDDHNGRVKSGWLLMARSGQTYGINGSVAWATSSHEGRVVSDDLLRIAIADQNKLRSGYLFVALSHPLLGRPLVKSIAYGSSIPHIDAADLRKHHIVRLTPAEENAIADLAEESATLRARADVIEREMAAEAGRLIDRFLAGDVFNFVVTMPAAPTINPLSAPGAIPEHSIVRLRRAIAGEGLKAGAMGTVVHVYEGGTAYEVEFLAGRTRPCLVTLSAKDLEVTADS